MSARDEVLLVCHQRAWSFRKSMYRIPVVNWRLRTPLPYRNLFIGAGLVLAWWALVALLGLGITGAIVTLAGPILGYRALVAREAKGAGLWPSIRSWARTAVTVAAASVRSTPTRSRVSSRARRRRVQRPWCAVAAGLAEATALTLGRATSPARIDVQRLPRVADA